MCGKDMFYLNLQLAIAKFYLLGKTILFMYKLNGMEQCIFVGFYLLKAIGE